MSDYRILLYSSLGAMLGIGLFFSGFRQLRLRRLIENIPTSKIRSLAMGLVEVFGEVIPAKNNIQKSPFSNKDCVFCYYTIEEYRHSGRHSQWVTIKQEKIMSDFFLKDDTGLVLVDPNGANIDIPIDYEYSSSYGKDPPTSIKQFLKSNNLSFEGFLRANKTMRYREYLIEPGDRLYIMGTAGDNPFVKEATSKENVADIMVQKGKNEKIYYISDKAEKHVLKRLRWKSILGIYGGSALIVICLTVIFKYLNLI